jgi:hypothetical protein
VRKKRSILLTPNDFPDLAEVERRLIDFERRYEQVAQPFEWKFTPSGSRQPASPAQGALGRGLTYVVELMILST